MIDHSDHGRGTPEEGPDDPDCPCRANSNEDECADAGCGFCAASRDTWEKTCMRERGKVLTGKYAHWCHDWDGLTVDETTDEFACCSCPLELDGPDRQHVKAKIAHRLEKLYRMVEPKSDIFASELIEELRYKYIRQGIEAGRDAARQAYWFSDMIPDDMTFDQAVASMDVDYLTKYIMEKK